MPEVKGECHRTICWRGKVEEITVDHHMFAWSGEIPCTGTLRCIYCGMHEDEFKRRNQMTESRKEAEEFIRKNMTSHCRTLREGAKYLAGKLTCREVPRPPVWHEVLRIAQGLS